MFILSFTFNEILFYTKYLIFVKKISFGYDFLLEERLVIGKTY